MVIGGKCHRTWQDMKARDCTVSARTARMTNVRNDVRQALKKDCLWKLKIVDQDLVTFSLSNFEILAH